MLEITCFEHIKNRFQDVKLCLYILKMSVEESTPVVEKSVFKSILDIGCVTNLAFWLFIVFLNI